MALFELDDVFTYQDANDIKRFWASTDAPANPGTGEVWLDLDVSPIVLKRWNGTSWEAIGELTANQLLALIKTVDGNGSGLDADLLDGLGSSSFMRSDTHDSVNANTQWQDSKKIELGAATDAELYSDGSDVYLQLNNNSGHLVFKLNGSSQVAEIQSALSGSAGSFTDHPLLRLHQTVNGTYNIGDIHGEIQFYTSDPGATDNEWPGVQAFIRAVTTRNDGITKPDTGLSFGVSNTSYTASEVLLLSEDGNMALTGDKAFSTGAAADLELKHDGAASYVANNINNGAHLYIQNKSHGEKIIMTCENSSGTQKTLMTLDPETDRVTTKLDRSSLPDLWRDKNHAITDSVYFQTGYHAFANENVITNIYFDDAFTTTPRVLLTGQKNTTTENITLWLKSITTNYFQVLSSHDTVRVSWVAIGEKT